MSDWLFRNIFNINININIDIPTNDILILFSQLNIRLQSAK